jgi:hypothetical protein
MKHIIRNFIILLLISLNPLFGQVKKVFLKDSTYLKPKNKLNYLRELKDTLPDGYYIFYCTQDSTEKSYENRIVMEGQYKDSLRHGKFIYYSTSTSIKPSKEKPLVLRYENYLNGMLNGYWLQLLPKEEGFYKDNKRHGIWRIYHFFKDDTIYFDKFYQNDSLIYSNSFGNNGTTRTIGDNIKGEFYEYDKFGNIKNFTKYVNQKVYKFSEFDMNGDVSREVEGIFKKSTNFLEVETPFDLIEKGVIRYYNKGSLEKEEYYSDGKLQKIIPIKE